MVVLISPLLIISVSITSLTNAFALVDTIQVIVTTKLVSEKTYALAAASPLAAV